MNSDRKSSYLKAAFLNVYNLSLLLGSVVAGAATGEYFLTAIAAGAEALWLLLGPDLRPFRRAVDRSERLRQEELEKKQIVKLLGDLPQRDTARARALDQLRVEIERDMKQNPSFQYMLLQPEIDKLSQLYGSFVSLAMACHRAETYLNSMETRDLQKQVEVQKGIEKAAKDSAVQSIAGKNVQVLEKRLATIQEIQNFLARARGQMNLIENSVRLLRDQILTMASPDQLGEQLDDLISGVGAIQDTTRESEAILKKMASSITELEPEPLDALPNRQRTR